MKALDYRLRGMTKNGNWRLSKCHSSLTLCWREDQAAEGGGSGPMGRET